MRGFHLLFLVLCVLLAGTASAQRFGPQPVDNFTVMKDELGGKGAAKGKFRVVAWGSNAYGQLGNGEAGQVTNVPVVAAKVEEILQPDFKVLQLASSSNAFCLLRSDKTVWCWGGLFFGPEERKFGPVQIEGLPPVKELTGGSDTFICATTESEQAWCFYNNDAPQRFKAAWASDPALQALSDSFTKVFVEGMGDAGCGVTAAGEAWCWGGRQGGSYPQKLKAPKPVKKANINGWGRGCALLISGEAWCWGSVTEQWGDDIEKGTKYKELQRRDLVTGLRDDGVVVRTDGTNFVHPVQTGPGKPLEGIEKISVGRGNNHIEGTFTCALEKSGRVWCWSGGGFTGLHYPSDGDYASLVRGPDSSYPLDHVSDLVVSDESAVAIVQDKDYKLVPESDPARVFYTLVYAGRFRQAKGQYSQIGDKLSKDDPLAPEALLAAVTADQADLAKVIAATGLDLELPGFGETALWRAVKILNYRKTQGLMIKVLLAHGAKPDAPGERGMTPVKYFGQWGDSYDIPSNLLKEYIKNGNKLSETDAKIVQDVKMGTSDWVDNNRRQLSVWIKPQPRQPAPPPASVVVEKPAANPASAIASAYVRSCGSDDTAAGIKDYSVVFSGKAGPTGPDGVTPFTVTRAYKGDLEGKIDIRGGAFSAGAEMLVFAHRRKDSDGYALLCTPHYVLDVKGGALDHALALLLIDAEMFNAGVAATGVFDKEYSTDVSHYVLHPDDVKEENWRRGAELLDAGGDYERSAKVYAALLAKMTAQRGAVNKRLVRDRYNPDRCVGYYGANSKTPPFVQDFGGDGDLMRGYGRALFMTGRYRESLRPLCIGGSEDNDDRAQAAAGDYKLLALLKTGEKDEADAKQLNFSGVRLSGVDMSGLTIERSNFTNALFSNINFTASRLGGSNFTGAQLKETDFSRADLRGANFTGAIVDATLTGADLTNVIYDAKTVWPKGFDPAAAGAKTAADTTPSKEKFDALPDDYGIAAIGVYKGTYPDDARASYDYTPVGRIDVEVTKTDKPVVIAVGSHDPAEWHFHLAKGARVAGVIVSRFSQQPVFGIPGDVPVIRSGNFYGPFSEDNKAESLKKTLKQVLGRDNDITYATADSGVFQVK